VLKKSSAQEGPWTELHVWCKCICSYTSLHQILYIQVYRALKVIIIKRRDCKLESSSLITAFNVLWWEKKRYYSILKRKTKTDFKQSLRKSRSKEESQSLKESLIRMILLQTQSLLIHDFTLTHINDATVAFLTHCFVQCVIVKSEKKWEVNQILNCCWFCEKLKYFVI